MPIHPTAQVDPSAEIDPNADIGAYVIVDGPVRVGAGTRVLPHAVLTGHTTIGRDNVIHYGAVIGHEPQDLAFRGAETFLHIGDRNVFREQSFIHRGTAPGSATVIGDDNYFMAHAHAGHNVRVGDHVIVCPGALLGGHVQVDDSVFISGNCVVHQYVRIGQLALLRGLSRTSRDVPPFCIMDGTHTVRGINRVGLQRAGYSPEQIRHLRRAFVRLFRRRVHLRAAIAALEAEPISDEVTRLVAFIRESKRGVCFGPRRGAGDSAEE